MITNPMRLAAYLMLAAAVACGAPALHAQEAAPDAPVAEATADLPSVDEIVAGYLDNTGGADAWRAITSQRSAVRMSMGPMEFTATVTSAMPDRQHIDVDVQGQRLVQAYDGEQAWQINPFAGGTKAQPMSDEEAEQFTRQEFQSPFLDMADKGHSAEVLGTKEVEGTQTYEVKLTKADGDTEFYYFDAEYLVPIMQAMDIAGGPMKGQRAETYLSDYQEVDGLMMPHFIETKIGGNSLQKMTITSIENNVAVDDALFRMPTE